MTTDAEGGPEITIEGVSTLEDVAPTLGPEDIVHQEADPTGPLATGLRDVSMQAADVFDAEGPLTRRDLRAARETLKVSPIDFIKAAIKGKDVDVLYAGFDRLHRFLFEREIPRDILSGWLQGMRVALERSKWMIDEEILLAQGYRLVIRVQLGRDGEYGEPQFELLTPPDFPNAEIEKRWGSLLGG